MSVVCFQVEICASGCSLVHRSPVECGVSECDFETSVMRTRSTGGCRAMKKSVPDGQINLTTFNFEIANSSYVIPSGSAITECLITPRNLSQVLLSVEILKLHENPD